MCYDNEVELYSAGMADWILIEIKGQRNCLVLSIWVCMKGESYEAQVSCRVIGFFGGIY